MMLGRQTGLGGGFGIIPDYQYSNDPLINPKINPFVKMPPGWTQRTSQPPGLVSMRELAGPLDTATWFYDHRKHITIGGAVVGGLIVLALVRSILR